MKVLVLGCLLLAFTTAFTPVWNAPTDMCGPDGSCPDTILRPDAYNVTTNANMSWRGSNMVLLYKCGLFPLLTAGNYTKTPCWVNDTGNCSWNPWGTLTPSVNGGVPQAANLTAHLEAVRSDIISNVPDPDFEGFLIIDWEDWRVPFDDNFDEHSAYNEYSKRLVRTAHPTWNSTVVAKAAESEFNAAAEVFWTATVKEIKQLRPQAKVGFYNYPYGENPYIAQLQWLWAVVDVLAPSFYYDQFKTTNEDFSRSFGAVQSALTVQGNVTSRRHLLVMPYVLDGLFLPPWEWGQGSSSSGSATPPPLPVAFTDAAIAASYALPTALGADGVFLWGSSYSVSNCADCGVLADAWQQRIGAVMAECVAAAEECRITHCSAGQRCSRVDLTPLNVTMTAAELCNFNPPAVVECI